MHYVFMVEILHLTVCRKGRTKFRPHSASDLPVEVVVKQQQRQIDICKLAAQDMNVMFCWCSQSDHKTDVSLDISQSKRETYYTSPHLSNVIRPDNSNMVAGRAGQCGLKIESPIFSHQT